jgi:hypothetical protein
MSKIKCHTKVTLNGETYIVYLKEVASRVKSGGVVENTCVKAFVRKASEWEFLDDNATKAL